MYSGDDATTRYTDESTEVKGDDVPAQETPGNEPVSWENLEILNDKNTSTGHAALAYAHAGIPVFPIYGVVPKDGNDEGSGWRCVCSKQECTDAGSAGKHPYVRWTQEATTDLPTVKRWWSQWPTASIGVPTGAPSGWSAIDLDISNYVDEDTGEVVRVCGEDEFNAWLLRMCEERGHPAVDVSDLSGLVQQTGSGGKQIILAGWGKGIDDPQSKSLAGWLPEVDLRGKGGYVIVPPSSHWQGGPHSYRWLTFGPPTNVDAVAFLRQALVFASTGSALPEGAQSNLIHMSEAGKMYVSDAVRRGMEERRKKYGDGSGRSGPAYDYELAKVEGPPNGARDAFFNAYAYELRKQGLSRSQAEKKLRGCWEKAERDMNGDVFPWATVMEKIRRVWDTISADEPTGSNTERESDEYRSWLESRGSKRAVRSDGGRDPRGEPTGSRSNEGVQQDELSREDGRATHDEPQDSDNRRPLAVDLESWGVDPIGLDRDSSHGSNGADPVGVVSHSGSGVGASPAGSGVGGSKRDHGAEPGVLVGDASLRAGAHSSTQQAGGNEGQGAFAVEDNPDDPTGRYAELNPTGLVHRYARMFAGKYMFVEGVGWHIWAGDRWKPDNLKETLHYTENLLDVIRSEMLTVSEDDRKQYAAFYNRAASLGMREQVWRMAASHPLLNVSVDECDANPWDLVVQGGTINLKDGTFRKSDPGDLYTKQANVAYDPDAKCPLWEKHVRRITSDRRGNEDKEMYSYLQRWCGYTLTGLTVEQQFLFAHGDGANGKNVTIDTLAGLLGSYAKYSDADLITASNEHKTMIAELTGARMVFVDEAPHSKISETKIKSLVGSKTIKGRYMRQDFFEFTPTFKLWLAGNRKPRVSDSSHGIWRRLALMPFDATIREDERVNGLDDMLKAEWPGILNWCLEGLKAWREGQRLAKPSRVQEAGEEYRDAEDDVAQFVSECFATASNENIDWTPNVALYDVYLSWAEGNGFSPRKLRSLHAELKRLGFERDANPRRITRGTFDVKSIAARGMIGPRLTVKPGMDAVWQEMYEISE